MGRRNKHDVFVIGDELSAAETTVLAEAPAPADDQVPGGHPQPPGLGHPSPLRRRRALAVLAIAGPTATVIGVLASALGTSAGHKDKSTSSPRSALVQTPAPRTAVPIAHSARPVPDTRPVKPSGGGRVASRRSRPVVQEPEREAMPSEAPESSLPIATPPAPEAPAPAPAPPSPPPPQSGGGPAGTERFGFER